jgi:hypothetical protein
MKRLKSYPSSSLPEKGKGTQRFRWMPFFLDFLMSLPEVGWNDLRRLSLYA